MLSKKLKVWLDDVRPMPEEYDIHVRTPEEAIELLQQGNVSCISLDHDLGLDDVRTGYTVALFIERGAHSGTLLRLNWAIHSANPVGAARMRTALTNADRYWNA